jgi:hypothetical protein
MGDPQVLDPLDERTGELVPVRVRHPAVPVSLDELAALKGAALEVMEARIQILETARFRAIRMTHPEDWVLFKSPDDRITAYLQDAGCERVRDILGIEIFDVTTPEKVTAADGKSFGYIITGRGRSRLTLQEVEAMEGGRESTDDFCKDLTGVKQDLRVRQAARANLDGNVVRELSGLKSVPIEALQTAWEGTGKKTEHCRRGRGFGSRDERLGQSREGEPTVDPPTCPHCPPVNGAPVKLKYRAGKGDRKPFYGCPNYEKHPQQKIIIDAATWIAKQTAPAAASGEPVPASTAAAPNSTRSSSNAAAAEPPPPGDGDMFGSPTRGHR